MIPNGACSVRMFGSANSRLALTEQRSWRPGDGYRPWLGLVCQPAQDHGIEGAPAAANGVGHRGPQRAVKFGVRVGQAARHVTLDIVRQMRKVRPPVGMHVDPDHKGVAMGQ